MPLFQLGYFWGEHKPLSLDAVLKTQALCVHLHAQKTGTGKIKMLLSVLSNSDICLLFSDFHTMPFPPLFYWVFRSLCCFQHSDRMKLLVKWIAPKIVSLLGIINMPCGFNSCIWTNIAPKISKITVYFESLDLYCTGKDDFFFF